MNTVATASDATSATSATNASARDAWDAAAQGWHDSGPQVRAWLHGATAALLDAAGVQAGLRVLDVAAGAGDQTLDIARRVGAQGHVLATDLSPGIVALGAAASRRAGLQAVEWRVADAQALDLAGAGFDAAVCRLGLMFCPQPVMALRAMHAALRPGARAAVLVFGGPEGNPCITALARVARRYAQGTAPGTAPGSAAADPFAPGTLLSLGRPGLLSQLMGDGGFEDVHINTLEAPFVLPSVQHYIHFLRSAAAPVIANWQALPLGAQQAAWHELTSELSAFNETDAWRGPNRLLLASGRVNNLLQTSR